MVNVEPSSSPPARRLLPLALLLLLAESSGHGYALEGRLAGLGRFDLPAGVLYRELRRLEDRGAVTSAWDMADGRPNPRRMYEITEAGRQLLEGAADEMAAFVGAIDRLLDRHEPQDEISA